MQIKQQSTLVCLVIVRMRSYKPSKIVSDLGRITKQSEAKAVNTCHLLASWHFNVRFVSFENNQFTATLYSSNMLMTWTCIVCASNVSVKQSSMGEPVQEWNQWSSGYFASLCRWRSLCSWALSGDWHQSSHWVLLDNNEWRFKEIRTIKNNWTKIASTSVAFHTNTFRDKELTILHFI